MKSRFVLIYSCHRKVTNDVNDKSIITGCMTFVIVFHAVNGAFISQPFIFRVALSSQL